MKQLLYFLIVSGLFAGAIALMLTFWPFFVGMAVFSALVLAYFKWREGAPAREEARLEREWAKNHHSHEDINAQDEARVARQVRLNELKAEAGRKKL